MMEATLNNSPALDREREKRKRIERRSLLFTTRFDKAFEDLERKLDLLIEENKQAQKELFPEPYKDWRTNETTS
jgi:hypothetical protein